MRTSRGGCRPARPERPGATARARPRATGRGGFGSAAEASGAAAEASPAPADGFAAGRRWRPLRCRRPSSGLRRSRRARSCRRRVRSPRRDRPEVVSGELARRPSASAATEASVAGSVPDRASSPLAELTGGGTPSGKPPGRGTFGQAHVDVGWRRRSLRRAARARARATWRARGSASPKYTSRPLSHRHREAVRAGVGARHLRGQRLRARRRARPARRARRLRGRSGRRRGCQRALDARQAGRQQRRPEHDPVGGDGRAGAADHAARRPAAARRPRSSSVWGKWGLACTPRTTANWATAARSAAVSRSSVLIPWRGRAQRRFDGVRLRPAARR